MTALPQVKQPQFVCGRAASVAQLLTADLVLGTAQAAGKIVKKRLLRDIVKMARIVLLAASTIALSAAKSTWSYLAGSVIAQIVRKMRSDSWIEKRLKSGTLKIILRAAVSAASVRSENLRDLRKPCASRNAANNMLP